MKDKFSWAKLAKKFQEEEIALKGIKFSFICYNKKEEIRI